MVLMATTFADHREPKVHKVALERRDVPVFVAVLARVDLEEPTVHRDHQAQ